MPKGLAAADRRDLHCREAYLLSFQDQRELLRYVDLLDPVTRRRLKQVRGCTALKQLSSDQRLMRLVEIMSWEYRSWYYVVPMEKRWAEFQQRGGQKRMIWLFEHGWPPLDVYLDRDRDRRRALDRCLELADAWSRRTAVDSDFEME